MVTLSGWTRRDVESGERDRETCVQKRRGASVQTVSCSEVGDESAMVEWTEKRSDCVRMRTKHRRCCCY